VAALVVAGAAWLPADAIPARLVHKQQAVETDPFYASFGVSTADYGTFVVTHADCTLSGAEPIGPIFASLWIGSVQVYYDSQSTGEGLGVTFAWRGMVPFTPASEGCYWQIGGASGIPYGGFHITGWYSPTPIQES
jgi:hypothetical protein